MARESYRRRRGSSRRAPRPSVSMATYPQVVALEATGIADSATVVTSLALPDVENTGGETENRKVIRVVGTLMFAAGLAANQHAYAMFALWAHPKLESFPTVTEFDPFNPGPAKGATTYEGRPSPRPFGRKYFSLLTPESLGSVETISEAFRYHTKAQRLLRPGWILSAGLWIAATTGVKARVGGILQPTVAG